jgi:tRNA dimethylallyltransferase
MSAMAMELAERLGGVVVNADSAQVYAELRIITARPGEADEARVEHRLYGHRPASEPFSVADWLTDVRAVLDDLRTDDRPAIIVGGTGLYFRALTEGLADVPDIPADIRAFWRTEALARGPEALHAELALRDPDMAARLRPSDAQRISRALEVLDATGRSLAAWQRDQCAPPVLSPDRVVRYALRPDRKRLHERINARFVAMIKAGALEEAREFGALGLDPTLPSMRAIGVRPLIAAARGDMTLSEAIERGQAESRQYAKRQVTWLRHQMADWLPVSA